MRNTKTILIVALFLIISLLLTAYAPNYVHAIPRCVEITQENETTVSTSSNRRNTIDQVPLFNQGDYPDVPYGEYGTIASHGCGIVSVAMVATYMKDEFCSPVDLAKQFGSYNTERGSYWGLFKNSAIILGIDFQEQTYSWEKVKDALNNGQVVIALQSGGLFTSSGHFIVLTGINEDGKIRVNDPNGRNWDKNSVMIEGFTNGFTDEQITQNGGPYWIYGPKTTNKNDPK